MGYYNSFGKNKSNEKKAITVSNYCLFLYQQGSQGAPGYPGTPGIPVSSRKSIKFHRESKVAIVFFSRVFPDK